MHGIDWTGWGHLFGAAGHALDLSHLMRCSRSASPLRPQSGRRLKVSATKEMTCKVERTSVASSLWFQIKDVQSDRCRLQSSGGGGTSHWVRAVGVCPIGLGRNRPALPPTSNVTALLANSNGTVLRNQRDDMQGGLDSGCILSLVPNQRTSVRAGQKAAHHCELLCCPPDSNGTALGRWARDPLGVHVFNLKTVNMAVQYPSQTLGAAHRARRTRRGGWSRRRRLGRRPSARARAAAASCSPCCWRRATASRTGCSTRAAGWRRSARPSIPSGVRPDCQS